MNRKWPVSLVFFTCSMLGLPGCDSSDDLNDSFDRSAFLTNFADNLIIPSYETLQGSIEELEITAQAFLNNPSIPSLETAQLAWKNTYIHWQYANAYNFGPGGEEGLQKGLNEEIGTFPISEIKISAILDGGTFNLNDFNRDARGLFAIEFLLFRADNENSLIVDSFSNANRKTYLVALLDNVKSRATTVLNDWKSGYRDSFISNNGTDAGSSTSEFYNEFIKSFEALKNFKVALPLGLRAGQTQQEPTKVEAFYSGLSTSGIKNHWSAMKNIWYGKNRAGEDGIGFYEYLQEVPGGDDLITATETQMIVIDTILEGIQDTPPFSQQLSSNTSNLELLSVELQKQTRYFKSDLSSLLGLAITYSSGDGD